MPLWMCQFNDGLRFWQSIGMIERTKCSDYLFSYYDMGVIHHALDKLWFANPLTSRIHVTGLFVQVLCVPDGHPYNIWTYATWGRIHVVTRAPYRAYPIQPWVRNQDIILTHIHVITRALSIELQAYSHYSEQ